MLVSSLSAAYQILSPQHTCNFRPPAMHLDMLAATECCPHLPAPVADRTCLAGPLQMPLAILGSLLRRQSLAPSPLTVDQTAPAAARSPVPLDSPPGRLPDNLPDSPPDSPPNATAHPSMKTDSGVQNSPATSRRTSISSQTTTERPKKRDARPKTVYQLAQPPHPRGKLHIRPKVVLQLHQVVTSRRPKPTYEVVPYSIFVPFSNRCTTRIFHGRSLAASDLLVLKAEEYHCNEDEASDEERYGSREVVAVIRPGREDKSALTKTQIIMENGPSWEVARTPNGGYEFFHVDQHGLALRSRWVPKPPHLRRHSSMSNASQSTPTEDRKFTFSTISPGSRRHPIIATLTRDRIQVSDSYRMPSATSPSTPIVPSTAGPTSVATPSSIEASSFLAKDCLPIETDDALRAFIVASAIWVVFQENWSSAYSVYAKGVAPPLQSPFTTVKSASKRIVSMPSIDTPLPASPSSSTDENKRTVPRIIRTHTQFLHGKTSAQNSPPLSPMMTRSRRSNSTGNTGLFGNGSLKKRFGFALEDQVVPETEEERSKRSIELLHSKESALPSPATCTSGSDPLSPIPSTNPESSPTLPDSRSMKTWSAYDPVPTKGMWDSGVVEGRGTLRMRPTSLDVFNDKKRKVQRREERSKSRDKSKEKHEERASKFKEKSEKKVKDGRKSERLRYLLTGIFHKEKRSR